MDDQALLEGIVVFSDEDGPGEKKKEMVSVCESMFNRNLLDT